MIEFVKIHVLAISKQSMKHVLARLVDLYFCVVNLYALRYGGDTVNNDLRLIVHLVAHVMLSIVSQTRDLFWY